MHDEILNNIVANAFNGFGDSSGSDDFGLSFAWIDLADFMEDYTPDKRFGEDTEAISAASIEYVGNVRYAMAYINQDGSRDVVGYYTKADVLAAFKSLDSAFQAFEEVTGEE